MHFHYIAGGDCCSRASGYLIFLILHTWNTFISGFRPVNSAEDHRPSLLVFITCWLDIRLQNPAPCKLFLGWATKFSRISASRSLDIQVFLAEWLVALFPSSWSPAFFTFMERDFLISFLPRGAFLIWEPIMADCQVKRWFWRIQASPLVDDCKISCRNWLSNSPTRDIYATSENTSDINP